MRIILTAIIALAFLGSTSSPNSAQAQSKDDAKEDKHDSAKAEGFKPELQKSSGSVTIAGQAISYDAFAGTIVVHPKGWDDVPQNEDKDEKSLPAQASMFYVAYFKSGEPNSQRPRDFLLQRRTRFLDRLAAHGSIWSEARGHA